MKAEITCTCGTRLRFSLNEVLSAAGKRGFERSEPLRCTEEDCRSIILVPADMREGVLIDAIERLEATVIALLNKDDPNTYTGTELRMRLDAQAIEADED